MTQWFEIKGGPRRTTLRDLRLKSTKSATKFLILTAAHRHDDLGPFEQTFRILKNGAKHDRAHVIPVVRRHAVCTSKKWRRSVTQIRYPQTYDLAVWRPLQPAAHPGSEGSDRSPSLAISILTNTVKQFTSSLMMTLIGFFAAFGAVAKFLEGGSTRWATNMARNQPKIHVGIRIRRTWQA